MVHSATRQLNIFLCHAPEDKKKAQALCKRLSGDGYDVSRSAESILPGQDWQLEILKALQSSEIVIICLSKTSVRAEGYFQKEIKQALERAEYQPEAKIFIIPVCLDECEVPERLKGWKAAKLFERGGYKALITTLNKQTERRPRKKPWGRWAVLTVVAFAVLLGALFLLYPPGCPNPMQAAGILIQPITDVELVSTNGAQGMLRSPGSIKLGSLPANQTYSLTLDGKSRNPLNDWSFLSVTTDPKGNVDRQYLLGMLPPEVRLCSGQEYRATFSVRDTAGKTILSNDDFRFKVEPADAIPYTLRITGSDVHAVDNVTNFGPIDLTHTAATPDLLEVKGDSLVTVKVQAFNVSGVEIPPESLGYHWELCCKDRQNKTSYDSTAPIWKFEPPTDIPGENLTITVSNENGYSINVVIRFKITPR